MFSNFIDSFLLAQLHVESLKAKCCIADMKYELRTLPEGSDAYDETYKLAIARIEAQPRDHRNLAEAVLKWVVYARRPLQPRELQDALAVEHGKTSLNIEKVPPISIILSVCGGLIAVLQGSTNYKTSVREDSVQLVHYTAYEYFVRVHAANKGWVSSASLALAQTCMTYLSFDCFASGPCGRIEEFTRRSEQHALFTYAAEYWGIHARDNEKISRPNDLRTLHDAICKFFHQKSSLNSAFEAMQPRGFWQEGLHCQRIVQTTEYHLAALFGLRIFFEVYLSESDQIDTQDSFGRSPLSYSASEGHVEVVQWLLDSQRVNVDSKDNDGVTPLSYAVQSDQYKVVSLLLESPDISPNLADMDGRTPLLEASRFGQHQVVLLLLKSPDINPNLADMHGLAPLQEAIRFGHEDTAEILLTSKGIDANLADELERTPLMYAARNGFARIARRLVEMPEVDTLLRDINGQTMLSQAAEFGHEEVIELMLSKEEVDLDMKDDDGQTLLSRTAQLGQQRIVRLLLLSGRAKVDSADNNGWTPLMFASKNGHDEIVELLLQLGKASTNVKDTLGWTPLGTAATWGNRKIVGLLLAEMRKNHNFFVEEVLQAHNMVLEHCNILARAETLQLQINRKFRPPTLKLFSSTILAELEPWLLAERHQTAGKT